MRGIQRPRLARTLRRLRARLCLPLAGLVVGALAVTQAAAATADCGNWPDWNDFVDTVMQADGRVIDHTTPALQTTSEGQSYALFFALVANDRATFDRVLGWTEANLAGSQLDAQLPAWQWGKKGDGSYGVMDSNSASDADAWIAYALIEASRLWDAPKYAKTAHALLAQVKRREVLDLPGLGPMLIPGEHGFALAGGTWRLNPSYLPLPVLRRFALDDPAGPWQRIAESAVRMIQSASPHGFAPDWLGYRAGAGFIVDPVKGDVGSYDAIRVYLWAGITSSRDPLAKPLLAALGGMRAAVSAAPPERVATTSADATGTAPASFSGALLPYLQALGDDQAVRAQRARIVSMLGAAPPAPSAMFSDGQASPMRQAASYYDRVLLLFGQGWIDGRYRFDAQGRLEPEWQKTCRLRSTPSSHTRCTTPSH
jgi:endoglucanase